MYCPKCGTNVRDDAAFCGNCGYQMPKKEFVSAEALQPQAVSRKRVQKRTKIIVACLSAFVVLCAAITAAVIYINRDITDFPIYVNIGDITITSDTTQEELLTGGQFEQTIMDPVVCTVDKPSVFVSFMYSDRINVHQPGMEEEESRVTIPIGISTGMTVEEVMAGLEKYNYALHIWNESDELESYIRKRDSRIKDVEFSRVYQIDVLGKNDADCYQLHFEENILTNIDFYKR